MLLALLGLFAPRPSAGGYTWSSTTTACARMSGDDSNIWADSTHGFRWNFDLHVQFPMSSDPDYMEKTVRVEFRRPLTIERIEPQGSATAINGGPNFVEVEVSPAYVGHEYFSIQGFREGGSTDDMLSPTITCTGGTDVPPPAPPHAADCDLAPQYAAYPLGGTREAGSDVTLKLSRWVPFRTFTLIYYGQEGLAVSKPQGVTIERNPQVIGSNLVGFTFTLDPAGSTGLRCEGHPACVEFEVKPAPHHKPHLACLDSPPPSPPRPPPRAPDAGKTPPPPRPPPTVASPPPPPPRGSSVRASPQCALGGSARVLPTQTANGASVLSVRVAVQLDNWIKGYVVTLGVDGDALQVTRAAHATPKQQGPLLANAERSFSFALGEEPVEMAAFAAVFEAQRWNGLVAMSCSPEAKPPPPPPPVIAAVTRHGKGGGSSSANYYGDDSGKGGGGDDDGDSASSYGDGPKPAKPRSTGAKLEAGAGGGSGGSMVAGGLIMLLTLAAMVGFVMYRGSMASVREMVAKVREAASAAKPGAPARKERVNMHDDETESMVAANLDDEEARREPHDRIANGDQPKGGTISLAKLGAISEPTMDEDEDLRVGEARAASVILGRPEI
jgi:hypothetical protein